MIIQEYQCLNVSQSVNLISVNLFKLSRFAYISIFNFDYSCCKIKVFFILYQIWKLRSRFNLFIPI